MDERTDHLSGSCAKEPQPNPKGEGSPLDAAVFQALAVQYYENSLKLCYE
jgi:hypothetical protein